MTPWKISLVVAVFTCAITCGASYRLQQQRRGETIRLREANTRLRGEVYRQHRESQPRPVVASDSVSPLAEPSSAPAPAVAPSPEPRYYRNEGNATPVSALQTFAWAADRGDAVQLQQMIVYDERARGKVAAYLDALPAEVKAKIESPEQLAALELTADLINRPYPRADLLARGEVQPVDPNRVVVRLRGAAREFTSFQQTPDGWKFLITEELVDAYLAERMNSEL